MSADDHPIHGCAHADWKRDYVSNPTVITLTTRLERVAEALFVQAITGISLSAGSTPSVKQVAENAIKQALVFERAWEARPT